jgi:hypothetical protein
MYSGSVWKWRRPSPSKVMERTPGEATEAVHAGGLAGGARKLNFRIADDPPTKPIT